MEKLKIFGVPWHTGHQYELAKLPFVERYDLLIEPYKKGWAYSQRPFPEKCRYVTHYKEGEYDFALLHLDQQCIYDPSKGDRIGKGRIYKELNEQIQDIPKVVIMHQTPYHDKYDCNQVVEYFTNAIGNNLCVVNSHKSVEQWGFGEPIIHGLDPDEWWDLPKEPRCTIVQSPAGMEKAYRRTFLHNVIRLLEDRKVPVYWVGTNIKFDNFDQYRDFLGRSLVFLQGTWQSPMPRSRTEAMHSGCCIVTTPYHGADSFIDSGDFKDGKILWNDKTNGFLTSQEEIKDPRVMDNPEKTADLIAELIHNQPNVALEVGQRGKCTAEQMFNQHKFTQQWIEYLVKHKLLNKSWLHYYG